MNGQRKPISGVILFVFIASMLPASTGFSKSTPGASEILQKVDDRAKAETTKVYLTQTIIAPSGDKRTFKMVSYSKGQNDKGLTEYLAPSQVKGMKILSQNDGDDIWTYFPSTNRVRKIASSARNRKVQGSDFSYEDMATGKMSTSWKGTVAGEETLNQTRCYRLLLTPTQKGPKGYKKVEAWVSSSDFTTLRVLYFDKYGERLKQLDIEDYRDVNGVSVPFKYTMTNLLDGGKTIMSVAHAEVNIPLDDVLFTESGLGK